MQLPILRTLALVAVGNAAIGGKNVAGFFPGDPLFQYSASLDFMTPRDNGELRRVSDDAVDWFGKLKSRNAVGCGCTIRRCSKTRSLVISMSGCLSAWSVAAHAG